MVVPACYCVIVAQGIHWKKVAKERLALDLLKMIHLPIEAKAIYEIIGPTLKG